jgi:serine/threonine protein kinase
MATVQSGLRANLDAWRQGRATQDEVETALRDELSADPRLDAAARSLIEAYRLAGHIPAPFAARLIGLQREVTMPGSSPLSRVAATSDLTVLRKSPPLVPAVEPMPPFSDKTVMRPRRFAQPQQSDPATATQSQPAPAREAMSGSILAGQYVLESIVPGGGSGATGVVYKARDLVLEEALDRNPYVAVKVLNEEFTRDPESMAALHGEYKKALQLSHPNIVKVQNFSRDGGAVFIVMELLEGKSLSEVIAAARNQGLLRAEALRTILALARGLAYAHQLGIVHSEFKPSNAFMTRERAIKVLDFGVARAIHQDRDESGESVEGAESDEGGESREVGESHASGETVGAGDIALAAQPRAVRSLYASCEQIEGARADPRDDVYALAVVSYELLTGRHPFGRKDAATARNARLKPRPVPGLSRRQWHTLSAALSFSREQRPSDAHAVEQGMAPQQIPSRILAAGAAALVLVLIAAAFLTAKFVDRWQSNRIAQSLASTDPNLSDAAVQRLLSADANRRAEVLSKEGATAELLSAFKRQARVHFDLAQNRDDFAGAQAILADAARLLPDSADLRNFAASLASEHKSQTSSLPAASDGGSGQPRTETAVVTVNQNAPDNKVQAPAARPLAQQQRVLDLARAGGERLDQAYDLYRQTAKKLPAADTWATDEAPRALAEGSLRRAQAFAESGLFEPAQAQAHKIHELPLKDPFYAGRIAFFDRLETLHAQLQSGSVADAANVIGELKRRDKNSYAPLERFFVQIVSARIRAAANPDQAASLAREARSIFPNQKFD